MPHSRVHVRLDGGPLATLIGEPAAPVETLKASRALVLSRFAWTRREGDRLIGETSRAACKVVLEDPRAHALMFAFASPQPLDAKLARGLGLPHDSTVEVASLLFAARLLVDALDEEEQLPLAVWEFHDLLFHARSRVGRHANLAGGTYRFLGRLNPAPALPADRWAETILLDRPDFERFRRDDPPLAQVEATRASIREYGAEPLSIAELGTFLYRVGRIEDYWELPAPDPAHPEPLAFVAKPYPSGGALYELELYAAVRSCNGIDAGLYHYGADRHRLERVSEATKEVAELIASAAAGMGVAADSMQVLIVVTARIQRPAWKYQSIAYALVLKNVGVALQTMYLAATAMRLAPCALGTGDSDLFARASGIDYYEEAAVGEFALGSRRAPARRSDEGKAHQHTRHA